MESSALVGVERRVFVASAGALLGVDVGDWIADAAAPFLARVSATDRKLLGTLLRSLEFTGPFFAGRWGEFSGMALEDRTRCFQRWSAGPAPLRQAAASLKVLCSLAYYGSAEGWRHAGYDGPWLGRMDIPVLPEPVVREGRARVPAHNASRVLQARSLVGGTPLRAEVCVIGAGAGGASAAARLAADGVDVLMIETGPYSSAADFTQRELDMVPLLFQDAGLRATSDKSVGIIQGRGVGGSTLHNTGLVYEAPRALIEHWRSDFGFPYDERRWQAQVTDALDTLGARPIPVDKINSANDVLRRGADALGWKHSVPKHNRIDCCGCGYCMLGCAYNRKLNASLTSIPAALRDGARLITHAHAESIAGSRGAWRVSCALTEEGRSIAHSRLTIEAKIVVVAAGAIDSAAMLLRSEFEHPRLGRGLHLHPTALVYAEFEERIVLWRGLPQSIVIEDFASVNDGARGGFLLLSSAASAPALVATIAPPIGSAHHELMGRYPHLAIGAVLVHDETEGQLSLGRDGDAVVRYWPGAFDLQELRRGIHALAELYLAAGATRVWLPFMGAPPVTSLRTMKDGLAHARTRPHSLLLTSVHPQSTCAIGSSADASVTGPYGELWDAPGVFVADASLFPTSVGVPPQLTVMAMAGGVGEYISRERF